MISWHVKIFVKKPNDFTMAKVTGPEMFEFTTCWGHDPAIFWVLKSRWSIHRCTNTISCYKNARSSYGFFIFYQKKAIEQRMKNKRTTFLVSFFPTDCWNFKKCHVPHVSDLTGVLKKDLKLYIYINILDDWTKQHQFDI